MQVSTEGGSRPAAQERPTAARSPRRLALGTRLTIYVTVSVAAVITLITFVGTLIAQRQLDKDLRETAEVTAFAVADEIALRQEPVAGEPLVPVLRSFMNAAPDLRSITVFRAVGGHAETLVSTSVVAPAPPALVQDVINGGDPVTAQPTPDTLFVAVAIRPGNSVTGAVAVGVSLGAVRQLQRTAGLVAFGGGVLAVVAIAILINLFARRLMLRPLNEIHRVMRRARGGDLGARAHVTQDNELRDVADGLNAMLAELDDLHRSLSQRVAAATGELRVRNEELVRSYESVSRLRETAARVQQLAAVGQTMANVAHQIGTPLNLVSGHVQLLQHEISDPGIRRRLRIVEEQIDRVVATVRGLLERARPQSERQPVRIDSVISRIGDAMRARLATSGVTLDLDLQQPLGSVAADESQLELALLNLVTNALDAMPDGGTLTLAAATEDGRVRIAVRDTGGGIDSAVLPRIFEPWVTTKGPGRGTGLGLTITRDLVTSLGGTIAVSTSHGRGTTFTIELPAAASAVEVS
ncbi:MAG TPA: ATP-binding protein [Vicinamibacterales bacterium]|jgi:signal transduction histidine kinase|nr:ATP-binding protein [Vicinamibacterales bacterium]